MRKLAYFSYKGGSGRTSLIYNTIPFLVKKLGANAQHPIVLVDMDLDSAGLSYILNVDTEKRMTTNDLFSPANVSKIANLRASLKAEPKTVEELDFFNCLTPVGLQFGLSYKELYANKTILFVPANPTEEGVGYDMENNSIIRNFVNVCKAAGCSAVIFDLPAGNQVVGKQAFEVADAILVCFRITKQHRRGTVQFLGQNLNLDGRQKYILVPNAVPDCRKKVKVASGMFNYDAVRQDMINKLKKTFEDNGLDDKLLITSMFDGEWYGVPEVTRFKLEEDILYRIKEDLREGEQFLEDEQLAYDAYDKLTDIIVSEINE